MARNLRRPRLAFTEDEHVARSSSTFERKIVTTSPLSGCVQSTVSSQRTSLKLSSEGRDTTTLSMRKQYIAGRYTYHPGLRTTIRILCIDSSRGRRKVEVHQCFRRRIRSAWSCGCRGRSLVRERHPEWDTKRDLSIRVSGTMEAILRESRVTYRLSPSLLAGSGLVSKLASSGAPLEA